MEGQGSGDGGWAEQSPESSVLPVVLSRLGLRLFRVFADLLIKIWGALNPVLFFPLALACVYTVSLDPTYELLHWEPLRAFYSWSFQSEAQRSGHTM